MPESVVGAFICGTYSSTRQKATPVTSVVHRQQGERMARLGAVPDE